MASEEGVGAYGWRLSTQSPSLTLLDIDAGSESHLQSTGIGRRSVARGVSGAAARASRKPCRMLESRVECAMQEKC